MIQYYFMRDALLAAILALATLSAAAQSFPSRPVKLIVPNPPGGVTDILARTFGQRLSELWRQQVIVENRPGAANIIGAVAVAKSPADGYTLLVASDSTFVINPHLYSKLPYDPLNDFTPVILLCQLSAVIAVNASLPVTGVRELIALARARPGSLSYGSMGSGTYAHISMEHFKQLAGVDIVHVPYKGSAPAMTDLLAGQISLMLVNLSVVEPYANTGKLRILAAATPKRLAVRPDLPTVAEAALPGWDTSAWFGVVGPANLQREVVSKIHEDVTRIIGVASFREQNLTKLGLEPVELTPEQFARVIKSDLERWGKLVRATGAKAD